MKYDKPYYVPVVVKSKDYLIGYIHASALLSSLINTFLQKLGLELDLSNVEIYLDSTRFNDIMINGKRLSEFSIEDFNNYIKKIVEEKTEKINEYHPDNFNLFDEYIFNVDCPCGFGFYSFKTINDIPQETFRCQNCGRVIIDYTGHWDNEYEFDFDGINDTRKD